LAEESNNNDRLLWMLGLAITLPMILLSGPLAGYLIGLVFTEKLGWPDFLIPLCAVSGLVVSGVQSFRIIKKLKNHISK